MDYRLEQRAKVCVSHDFSKDLLETLKTSNYKKPLISIDSFLLQSPVVNKALDTLKQADINYVVYDEIVPEPPFEIVNKGAKLYQENECDSIIAIGGGSVIDASRGINIVSHCGGQIQEYIEDKTIDQRILGLIAVPTTSGTGSELSNALVVTDTKKQEKLAVLSDEAVSEYVILVPELAKSMPKGLTISTGLDVFAHAMEAYTSNLSTPVVNAICEKIMFLVFKYLPTAVHHGEDLEARERMMVAAALGGWAINNGGTHLGHSIGHVVGAKYHLAHGNACAYALPGVIEKTALAEPKKIREIGNILELSLPNDLSNEELGKEVAKGFKHFRDEVLGLEPCKLNKEEVVSLTDQVVHERFAANAPFEVTHEIVGAILENYGG